MEMQCDDAEACEQNKPDIIHIMACEPLAASNPCHQAQVGEEHRRDPG